MGGDRLRAGPGQPAAARRPALGPVRAQAAVPHRRRRIRAGLGGRRWGRGFSSAASADARWPRRSAVRPRISRCCWPRGWPRERSRRCWPRRPCRWCLYVNLVIAAVAFAGALIWLREGVRPEWVRLDLAGTAAIVLGLVGMVYGFGNSGAQGWTDPWTLSAIIGGAALLFAFVLIERRTRRPLLPLRGDPRSRPGRGVPVDRDLRDRFVRGVPVPHLLPR